MKIGIKRWSASLGYASSMPCDIGQVTHLSGPQFSLLKSGIKLQSQVFCENERTYCLRSTHIVLAHSRNPVTDGSFPSFVLFPF